MLGLRSSLDFATGPAAGLISARAKLLGLLFDHVLVEAGAIVVTPEREQMSVRRERPVARGHAPAPWGPPHPADAPGALTAGFGGLIQTLRILRSEWGAAYVSPPDLVAEEDIADGLGLRADDDSVSAWLRSQLAVDLTLARRLRAALAPGEVTSLELEAAAGVEVSRRAAVCPDPGRLPWEQIEVLRTKPTMLAVRRLMQEMLSIARRPDSETALSTFEELGQDLGDLMWDVFADTGHEPRSAFTMHLAVPAYACDAQWAAVLLAPQDL